MKARSVLWWLVRALLTAGMTLWFVLLPVTEPESTFLFTLALFAMLAALLCVAYAINARGFGPAAIWIGRALALLGAAFAVAFPAQLYQEALMLLAHDTVDAWLPAAIWYRFALLPVTVVPAVVSLRWAHLGGGLFLLHAVFAVLESTLHPFGDFFPEEGIDALTVIGFGFLPPFATAILLLASSRSTDSGAMASPRPTAAAG